MWIWKHGAGWGPRGDWCDPQGRVLVKKKEGSRILSSPIATTTFFIPRNILHSSFSGSLSWIGQVRCCLRDMWVNRQIWAFISDIFLVQRTLQLHEDKHPQVWRWDHCFVCDTGIRLENGQHIFSWARNCLPSSKWATHTHIYSVILLSIELKSRLNTVLFEAALLTILFWTRFFF